jgi:hypothetical protein
MFGGNMSCDVESLSKLKSFYLESCAGKTAGLMTDSLLYLLNIQA